MGVFGAALALERLPYSLFSAHLLYELGHRYEGHAVSRFILEQIAWACAAFPMDSVRDIKKIVTTQTVSMLKNTVPFSGRLYGYLSKNTHIDYKNHHEFLSIQNGRNVIQYTHLEYYEYAQVVLYLADIFGIVWELSQREYLNEFESIAMVGGIWTVKADRPFKEVIKEHLAALTGKGPSVKE